MNQPSPVPTQERQRPDWLCPQNSRAPLSSNVGAGDLPFQRWFRFKEAYSPAFVADTVATCDYPVQHVLDPFGGSGTTALTARVEGLNSTSIEVNPFLADLIRAKVTPISPDSFDHSCQRILAQTRVVKSDYRMIDGAPATLVKPGVNGRYIYDRRAYGALRALNRRIALLDRKESRLARVLLGSILVDCSNVIVNGKGRRYRKSWQTRRTTKADVFDRFGAAVTKAVEDLSYFEECALSKHRVFADDARSRLGQIQSADLAVFSPPYVNSFDYTDVYNLELWMLGYLRTGFDNRKLRQRTIRSHVQVRWPRIAAGSSTPELTAVKKELDARKEELWNRNIPDMVVGYFADLESVLVSLSRIVPNGGHVVIAVGDSQYGGVRVPTAKILAELGERIGYEVVEASEIRTMRTSAQHGGRFDLAETALRLRSAEAKSSP